MNFHKLFIITLITIVIGKIFFINKEARRDLDYMYSTIYDSHPGIYNKFDPYFKDNLNTFYHSACYKLNRNLWPIYPQYMLQEFTNSFEDLHLRIMWNKEHSIRVHQENKRNIEYHFFTDDSIWITLPTFQLDAHHEKELKCLIEQLPNWRNKKALIFDLRKNSGGNSYHGTCLINALFGEKYANNKRTQARQNQYVEWRASKDNIEYLERFYTNFPHPELKNTIEGMRNSLLSNNPYYKSVTPITEQVQIKLPEIKTHIIVIIGPENASAALDFIDDLRDMDYTSLTFIGQPTKADRLYMDVRIIDLPSNKGKFVFPIKVFRNRARGDNQPYYPDVTAPIDNQIILENIVKSIIIKD